MLRRRITIAFSREFRLLQYRIRRHPVVAIISSSIKHACVERVKSSERDELKFIAHRTELALKLCDTSTVQFFLPIKRWRTIVSQQLVRELHVHALGESFCFRQIRLARFAPDQVG